MNWRHAHESAAPSDQRPYPSEASQRPRRRLVWRRGRPYIEGSGLTIPKDTQSDQLLDFQHFFLRRLLGANHQAPLRSPMNILDVGCGTGRWVAEMATEFPAALVTGLDLMAPSENLTLRAMLGPLADHVRFVEADVYDGLPFPAESFDYVHLRLMYCDLPVASWPQVFAELLRVTRPGGWIECMEPAADIYDAGPVYGEMSRWIGELCRLRGLDPDMGTKLPTLLRNAGLTPVTERVVPTFTDVRMTRERRLWLTQSVGVFEIMREAIVDAGIVTSEEYVRMTAAVRREFEQGHHANSDLLHIAFGCRAP